MPDCFIIMPITTPAEYLAAHNDADHFLHILEHLFIPAVEKVGYEAISPVSSGSDVIQAEIIRRLETADMVLCDISSLNPNVFFELGIRTAVDKPVSIVKDSATARIPFDTAIVNVLTYDPSMTPWLLNNEIERISNHLSAAINQSEGRNSLWKYFGLTTRATFPAGRGHRSSLEEKVDLLLLQMEDALRQPSQDIPRLQPSTDREALARDLIPKAERILAQNRAKLWNYRTMGNTVILDLNGYLVKDDQRFRIEQLFEDYGLEVSFEGGYATLSEMQEAYERERSGRDKA